MNRVLFIQVLLVNLVKLLALINGENVYFVLMKEATEHSLKVNQYEKCKGGLIDDRYGEVTLL